MLYRVAACLHVTAETAVLVQTLRAAGAEMALCAANPLSTQDEVAEAMAGEEVEVLGRRGEDFDTYTAHVAALAATGPGVTLDDGADLITAVHGLGGLSVLHSPSNHSRAGS